MILSGGILSLRESEKSNKYEIVSVIKHSDYSTVYMAKEGSKDHRFVIKVLKQGKGTVLIQVRKSKVFREIKIL